METVNCNLCQSDESEKLYSVPDILLNRPNVEATLVRCNKCTLVYQNPRPTPSEMGVHYPDEYESYNYDQDTKQASWMLKKAFNVGLIKRARTVTKVKPTGRLLDIGCSTGLFLSWMRENSKLDPHGVEISEHAAKIARDVYKLNVKTGTLEQVAFPDAYFDVVTMWDVFEHLHDPSQTLREIRRILKPDGVIVLRIPNIDSWDAKIFRPTWAGLDAPRHTYVFGRKTIAEMLTKEGFYVEDMNCNIGSYPTFLLSLRFWMSQKNWNQSLQKRINSLLYSAPMRLFMLPIFYLYSRGHRGPLLTVTAKSLKQYTIN